ncbi:MAG: hypothetical protein AAFY99_13180 [Pseudomonadota bacterium]
MPDQSAPQGQANGLEAYRYLIRVEANRARLQTSCRSIIGELTQGFATSKTIRNWDLKPAGITAADVDAQPRNGFTAYSLGQGEDDPSILLEISDGDIPVIAELVLGANSSDACQAKGKPVGQFELDLLGVFTRHVCKPLKLESKPLDDKATLATHEFKAKLTRPAYQAVDLQLDADGQTIECRLMISHRAILKKASFEEIQEVRPEKSEPAKPFVVGADAVLDAKIEIPGTTLGKVATLREGDLIPISGPAANNLLRSETEALWTFVLGEQAGSLAIQLVAPTNQNVSPGRPTFNSNFEAENEFKEVAI